MDIQEKQNQKSYKLKQYLGVRDQYEITPEEDKISAFEFNLEGNLSAIGDNSGRLIIFEENKQNQQFGYLAQITAHNLGHDWQKNKQISSKINDIKWMRPYGNTYNIITTNEKFIKLWKIKQSNRHVKIVEEDNLINKFPKIQVAVNADLVLVLKNEFPNLHLGKIKHISLSNNEQFLISSDEERIKKWSLEKPIQPVLIFDNSVKSKEIDFSRMEEQQEQWDNVQFITSSKFHNNYDNRFAYSTKLGSINYFDMRATNKCHPSIVIKQKRSQNIMQIQKYLLCISDFCFSPQNDFQLIHRDYLNLYLWDMRKPTGHVKKMSIFPSLVYNVSQLFQSSNIYDQFKLDINPTTGQILTNHYDKCFHEINIKNGTNIRYNIDFDKDAKGQIISTKSTPSNDFKTDPRTSSAKYNRTGDTIGVTSNNCLFFYKK